MCRFDCDEMTVSWPNDCIIFSFYYNLFIQMSNVTTFEKKFVDWKCSLDCDEMTVVTKWLRDYVLLLHIIH